MGEIVAVALTDPQQLDRLVVYLNEEKGIGIKRSRLGEILVAEGLRWWYQETCFGERVDPTFAEKRCPSSLSILSRQLPAAPCA